MNGAKLDCMQCDSPLQDFSQSLVMLLISQSIWGEWNHYSASPDAAFGLPVRELFQQGWRCGDSREEVWGRLQTLILPESGNFKQVLPTPQGVWAGGGQLAFQSHTPYYLPSFEHNALHTSQLCKDWPCPSPTCCWLYGAFLYNFNFPHSQPFLRTPLLILPSLSTVFVCILLVWLAHQSL